MAARTDDLFPLFLRLAGRSVLVVGAGAMAERKVVDLLAIRARVRVVAPRATARVRELADARELRWEARPFVDGDAEGAFLVIAATDDASAQAAVFDACERRATFCLAIDDVAHASALGGALVRRPPFLVAISSSGEAPALSRLLREVLEDALPEASWVEAARALREKWRAEGTPMGSRFGELFDALRRKRDGGG